LNHADARVKESERPPESAMDSMRRYLGSRGQQRLPVEVQVGLGPLG
jgi:hypothetical protein